MAYSRQGESVLRERAEVDPRRRALQGGALHPARRRRPTSRWSSRPGPPPRKVINFCANNYLGLSSHPDVIQAAHDGLDSRGYGMSSVRFICGTQDIHRELEDEADRVPGNGGHAALPVLHGRQRRRLRGGPRQGGRHHRRPAGPRLDRRRHPALQGAVRHLQALGHGAPRGEAGAARRTSASG